MAKDEFERMYQNWVNDERSASMRSAERCEEGYNSLSNKETTYAQSLKKMAEGHRKCLEVWEGLLGD